eukprot:14144526-Ditylum_brightwellii.AAC.1
MQQYPPLIKTDGRCYLVQWKSTPYTSQLSRRFENGIIEEGAAVCDGVYLLCFTEKKQWCTPYINKGEGCTAIRLNTVIQSNIIAVSYDNVEVKPLWGKTLRDMAQKCHAIYVPDDEHDDILETVFFREELGYVDATDYVTD